VSYRPGARFGPAHVRAGLKLLRPFNPALDVEPFSSHQMADCGDIAVNPFNIDEATSAIDTAVTDLRKHGSKLLTIGGDHTIALPILRSLARDHGKIAVLHFDAHLDTWDTYFGAAYTHGTPFRRASEEGVIDMERSLHIGIRESLYSKTDLEDDAVLGFQVIRTDDYEFDGGGQHRRAHAQAPRRRPGVRLGRHRRARSRARARHRHSRGRRSDVANCSTRCAAWSAST
jgi:agmatinase